MPTQTAGIKFKFVSQAVPEETFLVVEFSGDEAVSELYSFDITLESTDPELDLKQVLQQPAVLTILGESEDRKVHGILASFEQLHESDRSVTYKAVLVPRLWQADLYHQNQLFLDKSVPDIIEEILKQTGLIGEDYAVKLTRQYAKWEYICQYNETDFNFITRWMEREGIYYYFDQSGGDFEKVIITDSATAHQAISGDKDLYYYPGEGMLPDKDVIKAFTCRQSRMPKKVIEKDYNYRKPTLDLKAEAEVDPQGVGEVYFYGEHFKTPEEGGVLAKLRAEEILSRERLYYGESSCQFLNPGFLFEQKDHYRDSYNAEYFIIRVEHEGRAFGFEKREDAAASGKEPVAYRNRFTAIPSEVQFRPRIKTPKPRFYGTINAKVDAAGDGQYAEIDDSGRYKVKLPFDQSGPEGGKASRWVRMAQPYAGADYGMHFPLHKNVEVLLTFVNGDPDRPIIAGSVPNPDTMSPITGGNQTQSMIRTGGGNQIKIEDNDGSQLIRMDSPTSKSYFRIGATNNNPPGIDQGSDGQLTTTVGQHEVKKIGQDYKANIGGKMYKVVTGNVDYEFHSNSHKVVRGNATEEFHGNKTSTVTGSTTETFSGNKTSTVSGATVESYVGTKDETFQGGKNSKTLAVTNEFFGGAKIANCAAVSVENFYGVKISATAAAEYQKSGNLLLQESSVAEVKGKAAVRLQCGGSGISIFPGRIVIQAPHIVLDGPGCTVEVTSDFKVNGEARFTKNLNVSKKTHAKSSDSN